jgi:DNA polymerase IIIc chi subunit
LKECRYDLMHEDTDAMIVAHVWSQDKEQYLPHDLKRGCIRQYSEVECLQLGHRYAYEES